MSASETQHHFSIVAHQRKLRVEAARQAWSRKRQENVMIIRSYRDGEVKRVISIYDSLTLALTPKSSL
jgi:hypothetical protein